jgi:hypothetical protein
VDVYFEATTTEAQRNTVFQAMMYFVARDPESQPPPYDTVVANSNQTFELLSNMTDVAPSGFASGQEIGNIWGEGGVLRRDFGTKLKTVLTLPLIFKTVCFPSSETGKVQAFYTVNPLNSQILNVAIEYSEYLWNEL